MIRNLKKTLCLLAGGVALFSLSPSSAKAQHVVTQFEAGKLTLSSLTAKPAVVRHKAKHSNIRTVAYKTSNKHKNSRLVHSVAYKPKATKVSAKNAVYKVSSHKKSTKHRHRS